MTIRPYRQEDLETVLDIWHRASLIAHPFLDESFHLLEKQAVKEEYLPASNTWVCELEETTGGFVAVIGDEIAGLFVAPEFQRQGVGTALTKFVVSRQPHLEVDVFKENVVARQFYQKRGFRDIFERPFNQTGDALVRMRFRGLGVRANSRVNVIDDESQR